MNLNEEMKLCNNPDCGELKPVSEFRWRKDTKKYRPQCKACENRIRRERDEKKKGKRKKQKVEEEPKKNELKNELLEEIKRDYDVLVVSNINELDSNSIVGEMKICEKCFILKLLSKFDLNSDFICKNCKEK
jgi:DNA invertase Pin-like site-specific DNA recombinase